MAKLQRKDPERPDELRQLPKSRIELVELGDAMASRSAFEPGWRWSEVIKPVAGTEYCEFHHVGYTLSGRVHVVTREGAELELHPNEFFEIPPFHDAWVVGDEPWVSIDWGAQTSFGQAAWANARRVISTVLFTDIVDSTVRARELGDQLWHDLLNQHNAAVRAVIEKFGGREVNTTGDGFLVLFDGAERAIRAGLAMVEAVGRVDLRIRAGVHTGEVELAGDDVRGLAVHVAARVMALAGASEVYASWTVRDLVGGDAIRFEERGLHQLKGLAEPRPVYSVSVAAVSGRVSGADR